ncbi:MAG: hypothetical protein GY861_07790 [bacterium]|nr:hypothetical protein [bacterium]
MDYHNIGTYVKDVVYGEQGVGNKTRLFLATAIATTLLVVPPFIADKLEDKDAETTPQYHPEQQDFSIQQPIELCGIVYPVSSGGESFSTQSLPVRIVSSGTEQTIDNVVTDF